MTYKDVYNFIKEASGKREIPFEEYYKKVISPTGKSFKQFQQLFLKQNPHVKSTKGVMVHC